MKLLKEMDTENALSSLTIIFPSTDKKRKFFITTGSKAKLTITNI